MTSEILQKAIACKEYIVCAKRKIHREPELGMQEVATSAFVRAELEHMGVEIAPCPSGIGVLGIIHGTKKSDSGQKPKVSALRADMDALPLQESTGIEDASIVPGVMHACGHDCHTAMLLGAAKLLMSMKDQFSGMVKLIFQPAEEVLDGSQYMIDAAVLKNPDVEYILGIHGHPSFDIGQIALRKGPYMASADVFTATIKGHAGHSAYPHRIGADAVLAAANAIMALQSIVTRQIDVLDSVVLSICTLRGGSAKNIIPEIVSFDGSVRSQNAATRKTIESRILKILKDVSAAYGCSASLEYTYGVPPLANAPELTDAVQRSAEKLVGIDNVKNIDIPAMGSEDFSRYSEFVPQSVFARLGIRTPGQPEPLYHNSAFVFPEEALPYGTALYTQFVLDLHQ